jgi:hypothetical protein
MLNKMINQRWKRQGGRRKQQNRYKENEKGTKLKLAFIRGK